MADTKTSRLELRLTDAEKDLYQRAADRDNRPLSNWIRDRLAKAATAELADETTKKKRAGAVSTAGASSRR
jgi:uncharacterized protein (DUF1778 family)